MIKNDVCTDFCWKVTFFVSFLKVSKGESKPGPFF